MFVVLILIIKWKEEQRLEFCRISRSVYEGDSNREVTYQQFSRHGRKNSHKILQTLFVTVLRQNFDWKQE